jgi:hypothetical protein
MTNTTLKRKIKDINRQISNVSDFDVACSLLGILQRLEWELRATEKEDGT